MGADKSVRVEVRGLAELQRAFKQLDAGVEGELKTSFLGIAQKVVGRAQGKVPTRSGRAAGSIKPKAGNRGASIAFGGTAAPYFPWLNFGGNVGRNKSIHREIVKPDRYIYSSIAEERDEIRDATDEAVKNAAKKAGFETTGSN